VETRARVVEAGMHLARTGGLAAVTLDQVQDRAGVGRGQLYHYFDDRDDLIRAVVDHIIDSHVGEHPSPALTSLAAIDSWLAPIVDMVATTGGVGGCPIGSLVPQLAEEDETARVELAAAFARWEAPLVAGLTQLRERGQLTGEATCEQLAESVMAALQGALVLAQARRDPGQVRTAVIGIRSVLRAAGVPDLPAS